MNGKRKYFLDTAPIIYFLENDKNYGIIISNLIDKILSNGELLTISSLCYGEYLTIPFRNEDKTKEKNFYRFIKDLNIIVYDIDLNVMKLAARLRAKYKFLKMPDAIQIAVSNNNGCYRFITNDKQLKSIIEIDCLMLNEL